MDRVYIYGRGVGLSYLRRCINKKVDIIGYIDNYSKESLSDDNKQIIRLNEIKSGYSFIIVSIIKYVEIRNSLIAEGVKKDKIICFFDYDDVENERYKHIIDPFKWKTELMWKYHKEITVPYMYNKYYEENAKELRDNGQIPQIVDIDETINLIIHDKRSLVRFGDGEFEMMLGRLRLRYQIVDSYLSEKLKIILNCNNEKILVAIADNYGDLSQYTDEAASGIRFYLSPQKRNEHLKLLDMKRTYHNAYISRPYFIYRNKNPEVIASKFEKIKRIWESQEVLIVEGGHTRFGIGNDLLDNCGDIKRILVPDKNAFEMYKEILFASKKYGKDRLIISILGPTATVLTYDLANDGFWAIDLGQVDTEYEWFVHDAPNRCDVLYKTVSEYVDKEVYERMPDDLWEKYQSEIVDRIGINK